MTAAKTPAVKRLSELLNRPIKNPEQRKLQLHYIWIAQNGGLKGLHEYLYARGEMGLHHELTDAERLWLERVEPVVNKAFSDECERLINRNRHKGPQLSWDERRVMLVERQQKQEQDYRNRYSHLPKPQRKLSLAERMAAAANRLGLK